MKDDNNQQLILVSPMAEKDTIESLISTSGQEDFESLPLFYEGKIVKRISKEEIQGWNQNHPRQPFQKKQVTNRKRDRSIALKKFSCCAQTIVLEEINPPPSLKTIKYKLGNYAENNDLFRTFRTHNQMPEVIDDIILPKVKSTEEPKSDYIQGRKFVNFTPVTNKTIDLKPINKPLSLRASNTAKSNCKSASNNQKKCYKRDIVQRERNVSLISYPLDVVISQKSGSIFTPNKLHRYMRKYQIDIFL